jgi:hypothetical protein
MAQVNPITVPLPEKFEETPIKKWYRENILVLIEGGVQ